MSSPRYEPFVGGVEAHTRALATRFALKGHDVIVVTTNPDGSLSNDEFLSGVRVVRVPSWPRRGDPFVARGVGRVVAALNPDIFHAQGYQSAFTPMVLRTMTRTDVPTVLTFHGGGHSNRVRHALYPLQRRVLAPLLRRVNGLIVLTRFERELYANELRMNQERFTTIPNGCDLPSPVEPVGMQEGLVGSLGRLERSKGHERVLRAFASLHAREPRVSLRVIGRGPDESRLRGLAKELGVSSNVEFVFFTSEDREGLARCISQCALIVSMSDAETQPIALLEAARLNRSIGVSTRSAGMRELVADGVAWAIDPDLESSQLADVLSAALRDPMPPNTAALRTWDQCVDAVEALYLSVIATTTRT